MDTTRVQLRAAMNEEPLDVQVQAAAALANGRSLLVRLPTGTGKTKLSTAPFAAGLMLPKQMVYMTPLRTLTSAQAAVIRDEVMPVAWASGTTRVVSEQTGTIAEDPEFLAPAVVCTFDQALSAVLHIPYALSPRRRNITAGAVGTSYIVADEVHLYPRGEALATLLWFLTNRPPIPFCLMTATMTQAVAERLAEMLRADPILMLPDQDRRLLGLTERRRTVRWQAQPVTVQGILREAERASRILIVVNTVDRAIRLGRELRAILGRDTVRILHSRFYRRDRDRITGEIFRAFGRGDAEGPRIVVATQVVEVGLDISADTLITELAPANALVQRWGRCARWGGTGSVIVAEIADRGYPYAGEEGGEQLLEAARTWLAIHAAGSDGCLMGEVEEQEFIECGHGQADVRWLDGLRAGLDVTASHIAVTVRNGEYANAGLLIRNVDQRTLIIHGDPQSLWQPNAVEGFGLRLGTLIGLAKRATQQETLDVADEDEDLISFSLPEALPWTLKLPTWPDRGERSNARPDEVSGWRPVVSPTELGAEPLVVVHPRLVYYEPDEGLQLQPGDIPVPAEAWASPVAHQEGAPRKPFTYERETAEQHIARALDVLHARSELWPRLEPLISDIEAWLAWPSGLLRRVVEGSIVAHDSGKLTRAWQEGIKQVQERRGLTYEPWLVHSDSTGGADPDGPRKMPPHARSGAAHALALAQWLDGQVDRKAPAPGPILFSAIATHHNPTPRDLALGHVEILDAAARIELGRLLGLHGLKDDTFEPAEGEDFHCWMADYSDLRRAAHGRTLFAFSIVVRLLRLADGWSQERGHLGTERGEEG